MAQNDKESADSSNSGLDNRNSSEIAVFKAITDHYKQDLREFFTRSNFYLAVQGALVYGFLSAGFLSADKDIDDFIVYGVCIFGMILSVFWWLVARGSCFWIRTWRHQVRSLSKEFSGFYNEAESKTMGQRLQSPEEVTRYLPVVFGLIWALFLWQAS